MPSTCIACGFHLTHEVYRPGDHPLSVLALPRTEDEARNAMRFPMNFRACATCGHIFNVDFDYYQIPYEEDSNLMYNKAPIWTEHLEALIDELVEKYDVRSKCLVDIGCGDGGFLKLLVERHLGARCIGFEPGIEADNAAANGLEVFKDYFVPMRDLARIRPDFLICRHVIEHMAEPRQFVAEIAYWCNIHHVFPIFLVEVPRIDRAIAQGRINDFLYEHPSNFTQFSFQNMFEQTGYEILYLCPRYHDEVTVAFVRAKKLTRPGRTWQGAEAYRQSLLEQAASVRDALWRMRQTGKTIAFWGATGKGASFLNAFELSSEDWPTVVDSDYKKVGRYVPRTAQLIRPPEYLQENPVDVIIITTQWRAKDIAREIKQRGIQCGQIMILADHRLKPFNGEVA